MKAYRPKEIFATFVIILENITLHEMVQPNYF